jgi:hypothetical protein
MKILELIMETLNLKTHNKSAENINFQFYLNIRRQMWKA